MRNVIEGFNQKQLVDLELNCVHALLLEWFVYFARSGNQKVVKTDAQGHPYFWVSYQKVFEDLPTLPFKNNPRVLARHFEQLAGMESFNPNHYPLVKETINTGKGRVVCFAMREKVLAKFKEAIVCSDPLVTTKELDRVKSKDPAKMKKERLNPNFMKLFERVKSITDAKGDFVFRDKVPLSDRCYTNEVKRAESILRSIYIGAFFREFNVSQQFVERNRATMGDGKYLNIVESCAGSWNKIEKMVVKAAKNYSTWFDEGREPTNKTWLPRNLARFLFFEGYRGERVGNGSSLFLACLTRGAFPIREAMAEAVFDSIPFDVRAKAEQLFDDSFDGTAFWTRIKQLTIWYKRNAHVLNNKDTNAGYWLQGSCVKWFGHYVDWIKSFTKTIHVGNLGTDNATFACYLRSVKNDFGITTNIPTK